MNPVAQARLRTLRVSQWCARILVVGAFALSGVALCDLATAAHIPVWLAWIWPVCVDGLIFQAAQAVSALAGRKDPDALTARRWFQWVIGGGVLVSVAANALHAWTQLGHPLTWWQVTAVAVVPPILLLVATHGVTILAGVDIVGDLGEPADLEQGEADREFEHHQVEAQRVTVERVEPVAEPEQPRAIEQPSAPELTAGVEPQVSIEPATAGHPRRAVTQRDPGKVLAAQQLAAKAVPVDEIAQRLEVSSRTVRRYLAVEVTEMTETTVERPQLFAVGDTGQREVVNG